ncbi:MAG TPA: hypothetical protein VGN18_17140 [Jatrophihabitans sp.]|uniref:hypothetical protein n=1 Tax=Jatrophihabitans sp. TaxID=1932789 RepID=UPI002E00D639|nr:hypothetical protein [Jatrophihabitans sp.]
MSRVVAVVPLVLGVITGAVIMAALSVWWEGDSWGRGLLWGLIVMTGAQATTLAFERRRSRRQSAP